MRNIAFLCILFLLFSCSKQQNKTLQTEIKFMHGWGGNGIDHQGMRKIFSDFESTNNNIKLIFDSSPDISVVIDKANDMLAADRMPDIISTNGRKIFVSNAIKKEAALNLTPFIKENEDFYNSLHPVIAQKVKNGESVYSIPDVIEVQGLWYNKKLLQEIGIIGENDFWQPTSWNDFFDVCKQIISWSKKYSNDVLPFAIDKERYLILLGMIIAGYDDGNYLTSLTENYNDDILIKALEKLKTLRSFSEKDFLNSSINETRQLFINGKTVFFFNGVWDNAIFEQLSFAKDLGYAPYPSDFGKTVAYISLSDGYVISNRCSSKKQKVALSFLQYIISENTQTRIATETLQVPFNPAVKIEKIKEARPLLGMAIEKTYAAQIQVQTLYSLWNEEIIAVFYDNLEKLLNDTISSKEVALLMEEKRKSLQ